MKRGTSALVLDAYDEKTGTYLRRVCRTSSVGEVRAINNLVK